MKTWDRLWHTTSVLIIKIGKLKNSQKYHGDWEPITLKGISENREVDIIKEENDPIYGKRYKILGFDEWIENNCFEYIKEK